MPVWSYSPKNIWLLETISMCICTYIYIYISNGSILFHLYMYVRIWIWYGFLGLIPEWHSNWSLWAWVCAEAATRRDVDWTRREDQGLMEVHRAAPTAIAVSCCPNWGPVLLTYGKAYGKHLRPME